MRNEKIKRFGFTQLRFVIAAILFLAAGLKAYQLATAPLPPVVQGSVFTPLLELLNDRYFLMIVVVSEILFALVLIAHLWRSWMWLLSLLGFTTFTLISVMKGVSGESSCGCFGTVTVNPWITATLDAAIVGLLLIFRERIDWTFPKLEKKKVLAVLIIWLALTIPLLFAMLSLKQVPHATLGTEFTGADGRRTIMLEPHTWDGKRLPLFEYVDDKARAVLEKGKWNIVISRKQCEECKRLIERLGTTVPLALLKLDDGSTDMEQSELNSMVSVTGSLKIDTNWVLLTPLLIRCQDGVCVTVGEDVFSKQ